MKVVAIVSGGMDSVTMAYLLKHEGWDLHLLSFDYGQRHRKELQFAYNNSLLLDAPWRLVDLHTVQSLLGGSALTDTSIAVPHGHYADETMKKTVVPNRNSIMLNIAAGWAISLGAQCVATAVHAGDHAIYPDCRPEFLRQLEKTLKVANEGFIHERFLVIAPFVHNTKTEIAQKGRELGVDWKQTWSCYEGGEFHCGLCGTCIERREAFHDAGVDDPTEYMVSLAESFAAGKV